MKKWWLSLSRVTKVIVSAMTAVITFLGFIAVFKSDKQKFEDDTEIRGSINPKPLSYHIAIDGTEGSIDYILKDSFSHCDTSIFYVGDVKGIFLKHYATRGFFRVFAAPLDAMLYKDSTDKNIDLMDRFFKGCVTSKLIMTVVNNRVYVKADFRDINTGKLIGSIRNEKWVLYKADVKSIKTTDSMLEVIDNQGFIVFSLRYIENGIVLNGYFMDGINMLVLNNSIGRDVKDICFDMRKDGWKFRALSLIQTIPSVDDDTFSNRPF